MRRAVSIIVALIAMLALASTALAAHQPSTEEGIHPTTIDGGSNTDKTCAVQLARARLPTHQIPTASTGRRPG
jgi:hypothetical protein